MAFRANRRGKNVSLGPKSRNTAPFPCVLKLHPDARMARRTRGCCERAGGLRSAHGAIPRSRRGVFAPVDDMGDETASSQKAPLLTEAQPEAPAPG